MTRLDAALALAARGFHVFPLIVGGKTPAFEGWQDAATADVAQIRKWWDDNPRRNIGISTSHGLLVVDVDMKPGKDGNASLLAFELEGFDLPDTYEQRTPSGGRHLFFRIAECVPNSAGRLGPGLDIRSRGGLVVGAGSAVASGEYTVSHDAPIAEAPIWLVERCGRTRRADSRATDRAPAVEVDADRAVARARHFLLNEAPLAVEGAGGDETTYKVAARVKDFGIANPDACFNLMAEFWNDRCSPPWLNAELMAKVRNAYAYSNDPVGVAAPEADFDAISPPIKTIEVKAQHPFDKLNTEFAFCLAGGGAHILWETTDARGLYKLEHLALSAFHQKFAAQKIQVGKKESPVTVEWMEWKGRRSYDGLVFMPEQPAPARFYNLWRGFAVEPAVVLQKDTPAYSALDAFLAHAKDNVCRGDAGLARWLIGYFAHMVQRPYEKPLVAIVLRGGKGVGKNALVDCVAALLGGHALLSSNRRYLVGNFNGHLENLLLFALDEAFWSGDKQAEGQLKDLITGKNHVIEHKGKEPYTVENRTRVVVIGNEDWLVPASHDERRFAVFDVGDGRKQDRRFFEDMRLRMEGGGYRLLLRHLLDFDLAGLDFNDAPNTQGLLDQKHATLEPLHAWWLNSLEEGRIGGADFEGWPAHIEKDRLRAALRRYLKDRNVKNRHPDEREIGRAMAKCCPSLKSKRMSKQTDGSQPYQYVVPALAQARAEWCAFIGHAMPWQD